MRSYSTITLSLDLKRDGAIHAAIPQHSAYAMASPSLLEVLTVADNSRATADAAPVQV
jgi:hypothetical protein